MNLTRAGEYAIRCVLYLATQEQGPAISRRRVAQAMDIPLQFLGKIAQRLSRAGLIEIAQGAKGGYRLARRPRDISLLDVIEAVEGQIFLNQCLMRPDSCQRTPLCPIHQVWERARDDLRRILGEADFAGLARQELGTDYLRPLGVGSAETNE